MDAHPHAAEAADPTVGDLIAARPHLAMHAMDGLVLEDVPLNAIADALGTPVWVYGAGTMRRRLAALQTALAELPVKIHYAVKANDHLAVLTIFASGGPGWQRRTSCSPASAKPSRNCGWRSARASARSTWKVPPNWR